MTEPIQLSPAAQAVLDAWAASENGVYLEGDPQRLAAALRALVETLTASADTGVDVTSELVFIDDLLAIAAELKEI